MSKLSTFSFLAVFVAVLTGCASPKMSTREIRKSDPAAAALLEESQRAHGRAAFGKVRDLSVRYEGRWGSLVPRFQPVLADTRFRLGSEERLLVGQRIIAQDHSGPAGEKMVVRTPGKIVVAYNGTLTDDAETRSAAALVADAYTLFLLGPFYFDRPGVVLIRNGESTVDKAACDEVLAVLRPGFGEAEEDRVILSIDRSSKVLRRVRMTLNGLESTRGAEVDVTFRDFRKVGGILWPTDFVERVRVPFDLHAHHWRMLGLEINRGIRPADLTVGGWKGRAKAVTAPLPSRPD